MSERAVLIENIAEQLALSNQRSAFLSILGEAAMVVPIVFARAHVDDAVMDAAIDRVIGMEISSMWEAMFVQAAYRGCTVAEPLAVWFPGPHRDSTALSVVLVVAPAAYGPPAPWFVEMAEVALAQ